MSVQTEIDRIITAVGAAYDAVEENGCTLPASETVANLAEAINSIPKETHQAVEQATPSLSLNSATGVVTAEATQAAGLVSAGTKKATMQLATQAAKTVTPSAAQQTAVASGKYTTGNVVVAAVPTEAKTVELSMPSGNQTVSPSSGKFLNEVTVKKPATMLPENIKKGVSIGGVVGTLESGGGSTSETWVLNKATEFPLAMQFAVNFNSNGKSFTSISAGNARLFYGTTKVAQAMPAPGASLVTSSWCTEAYRKLVFDTPPTGDLLTWLTANGVKQPANLAVQPSKDVTVTSNGTTEITPDAPYDALKKVNLPANVVADVPLVTVTFKATQFGDEISSPGEDVFVEMQRIVVSAFVDGNISLDNMYNFSNQWGGMVFPFDVAVPQCSSVTICVNAEFSSGVSATNALVARCVSATGIKSVYTIYNITDGATITIDVS